MCSSVIEKYLSDHRIFQYRIISPQIIPFSQSVSDACIENKCGKYNTCWTCPPGVGNYRQLEKKIKSYSSGAVFTCKYDLVDPFDFENMEKGAYKTALVLKTIT